MIYKNAKNQSECRRRARCEYCGSDKRVPFHCAHIMAKGMGGGNWIDLPANLTCLCWLCHNHHHDGHSPTAAMLLNLSAWREKATADTIQEAVWLIQRTVSKATGKESMAIVAELVREYGLRA